jgi:uncharacterized protein (DUF58 family)
MPLLPSRTLLILLLFPLGISSLSLLDPHFTDLALAVDLGLLVLAALDALLSSSAKLVVERRAADVFSVGRKNAVTLRVRSRARRSLRVEIMDDLFDGAEAEGLPAEVRVPARGRAVVTYRVVPSVRGTFELGDHYLRYDSLLGLWLRQLRVRARQRVRVYPDLRQIQSFDALARENRELALVRASRRQGGQTEFARLRDHVPDDEFRAIDWKATARRDRLTSREYQLESNQSLMFLLEGGRMMTGIDAGLPRYDHALNAALMLGHVAARTGDRVGVLGFDDAVRVFVPPTGGSVATRSLIRATYGLHPRLVEPDYDAAFEYLVKRVRTRSLVVLFSHVLDDSVANLLVRRLNALRRRHLPLVVMFRDRDIEGVLTEPSQGPRDYYSKGAAAELLRWRESVVSSMKQAGAMVLEAKAAAVTGELITRYLDVKARHLL